jgi:hypothetical protein
VFTKWGNVAYRHRRLIPAVVIAVIALLYLGIGTQLGDRMSSEGWDDPHSESTRAAQIEEETFGRDASGDVIILVTRDADAPGGGADLTSPAVKADVSRQINTLALSHSENIRQVTSYFDSNQAQMITGDHSAAFASVALQGTADEVLKNYRAIEDDLHGLHLDGATVEISGATAVSGALDTGMSDDISRAEIIGLPAVAVLLILVFGSVVAACMPLLVGILSILGSMGILSLLAGVTTVNTFAQSVVTLLGLGLAIDYGLFMVSRFREELAEGNDVPTSVRNTTASAGKTVVFSALMVAVALSGLLLFPQAFLKSVAYGAISAVLLAALLSVMVLPSVFSLLGRNIDKWTLFHRGKTRAETVDSAWGRVSSFAMRHAKIITVGLVGVLLALTVPLGGVKFGGINETFLPPDEPTRVAQNHFDADFPQLRTDPVKLVVTGDNAALGQVYQQANAVHGLTAPVPGHPAHPRRGDGALRRHRRPRRQRPTSSTPCATSTSTAPTSSSPAPRRWRSSPLDALFGKLPWMLLYIIAATFILLSRGLRLGHPARQGRHHEPARHRRHPRHPHLDLRRRFGADLLNFTAGPADEPRPGPHRRHRLRTVHRLRGLPRLPRMVEARAHGATTNAAIRFGTATTGGIITAAAAHHDRGLRRVRLLLDRHDEVHRLRHDRRAAHRRHRSSACCSSPPSWPCCKRGLLVGAARGSPGSRRRSGTTSGSPRRPARLDHPGVRRSGSAGSPPASAPSGTGVDTSAVSVAKHAR